MRTRATLYRGGTSKAMLIKAEDAPWTTEEQRDEWILAAFGSPDPRQIDGIGGAETLTSKFAVVGTSDRPDADLDYTFAQVGIADAHIDNNILCGNISAAIGPFAIDEGMVDVTGSEAVIRIFNTNTQRVIVSTVQLRDGQVRLDGTTEIAGVPGTAAPIVLDYSEVIGARTGALFPTGNLLDQGVIEGFGAVDYSLLEIAGMLAMVPAEQLGLTAHDLNQGLESRADLLDALDDFRCRLAVQMGLVRTVKEADEISRMYPFVGIVAPSREGTPGAIAACVPWGRYVHKTFPGTGAIPTAVAASIPGTTVYEARISDGTDDYVIEHPSGTMTVKVNSGADGTVERAQLVRTARRLFEGSVIVDDSRVPWFVPS